MHCFNLGGRSQLSVTIVEVAGSTPAPSPLSDHSNDQLLQTPLESGEFNQYIYINRK